MNKISQAHQISRNILCQIETVLMDLRLAFIEELLVVMGKEENSMKNIRIVYD